MSLGGKTDRYGLVNGYKFPDAMAGGVLCGIEKMPMLLTDGRSIPNGYEHKKAIVFGGKEVVNIDEFKILEIKPIYSKTRNMNLIVISRNISLWK